MISLLRLILLMLLPGLALAAPMTLWPTEEHLLPAHHMQVWEDPSGTADREQVTQLEQNAWQAVARRDASFGYSGHAYWLRLKLYNPLEQPRDWVLLIGNPLLDYLDVYGLEGEQPYQAGDQRPFQQRWIEHRQFALPLRLAAGEEREILLRMQTQGSANLSASLMSPEAFNRHEQRMLLLQGLFFGALLVMLIYNLSIFFITRERNYLWYSLFVANFCLYQFIQLGFAFQWLWPEALRWQQLSFPLSSAMATLFGILFTYGALDLKNGPPIFTRITQALLVGSLIVAALALLGPYTPALIGSFVLVVLCSILAFTFTLIRWHQGYQPAKLFALGWSMLILASLFSILSGTGVIANSLLTLHAQQIGGLLELMIFSIALGSRIRHAQLAQQLAQTRLLANEHQLRMEQAKSLLLQKEISEGLEARVTERTASLQQAMQELGKANQHLADLSRHDNLTGLFNRQVLNEELDRALAQARRSKQPMAILMLDLDFFKSVNDEYDHLAGDACLQHAAKRMQQRMRSTDLLARFGGEEFAAVLCDTDLNGALGLAEQLREDLARHPCYYNQQPINLSLSIGVCALVPDQLTDREQLLRLADQALYRAKANGRNRIEV